jgi:hypothetical protein
LSAIQRGQEENELRHITNTPLGDTIIQISRQYDDPIMVKVHQDIMKPIGDYLGFDVVSIVSDKLENFLVEHRIEAYMKSDRDAIIEHNSM